MKAKKIIIIFLLVGLTAASYSQESTKKDNSTTRVVETNPSTQIIKDTWNGITDAYLSGEAFEAQQKFCYGLLKQGATAAEGIGESLFELPENLVEAVSEYEDAVGNPIETMYYFGKYSLESIYESMSNIYCNYTSGDPERIGAATFDIGLTVATVRGGVKGGKTLSKINKKVANNLVRDVANKYGPKYHYTNEKFGESIRKGGLQVSKTKDGIFATYDGSLSGAEAQARLALPQEMPPNIRIKIYRSVKPQEIREVAPKYGQPGGGSEQLFYTDIPSDKILSVDPIPLNPSLGTRAVRMAGETINYIISYKASTADPLIAERNAVNKMNANEGGHTIEARISTIVYVDDSIEPGETMLFGIDGTFLLGINSKDIDKVAPEFLGKISNLDEEAILPDPRPKRNRDDVIPERTRSQRGL
ncbi:MAG: hypothetical protein J6X88_08875 [Bacteroidales bacterium]|nr:hypothetical protein [Bacteroidales bacterium]